MYAPRINQQVPDISRDELATIELQNQQYYAVSSRLPPLGRNRRLDHDTLEDYS